MSVIRYDASRDGGSAAARNVNAPICHLFAGGLQPEDGFADLDADAPGLGISLSDQDVDRFTVAA
jgi:hypothetical protein